MSTNEDRLTAIEMQLAHHDRQLQDMNDIMIDQQKMIDRLKNKLIQTEEELEDLRHKAESGEGKGSSITEIAARDKPPHY